MRLPIIQRFHRWHARGRFYDWHSVYQLAFDRLSRFNNAFTHNSKVSSLARGLFYDWHSVYQVVLKNSGKRFEPPKTAMQRIHMNTNSNSNISLA